MQDEHFLRHWTEGHTRFSADLGRMLNTLFGRGPESAHGIDNPYASDAQDPLREATNSLASGLAAVATTLALFVAVGALAIPASAEATPGQLTFASVLNEGLLL